jgi:hypothetical protein
LTARQHLEQADLALRLDLTREAANQLEAIPRSAPEAVQAKVLGDRVLEQRRKDMRDALRSLSMQKTEQVLSERNGGGATASALGVQIILSGKHLDDIREQKFWLKNFRDAGVEASLCKLNFREVRFTKQGMASMPGQLILPEGGTTFRLSCR